MTIRRQYQLPNCSLILDGLCIDSSPGNEEVMSLLVNAECRISGLERSLNGGYNFFSALVRAVSQYSQEVLSGFAHPQVVEGEPLLVHINPGDGPYHHLVIQPEIADLGSGGDGRAVDIKLSSVQLFDLIEAVDQFFGDRQTLPELEPSLTPLPRRFVRNDEPLSDRALPAVLGVGSLVAAAMAFSLLPIPEARRPLQESRTDSAAEVQTADARGTADSGSSPQAIEAADASNSPWQAAPRITDSAQVAELQETLQAQLTDNLDADASFSEPLNYQVAVSEAGEVVGFQYGNEAALRAVDNTPLPRLIRSRDQAEGVSDSPVAEYQVTFSDQGVEVTPSVTPPTTVAASPEATSTSKNSQDDSAQSEAAAPDASAQASDRPGDKVATADRSDPDSAGSRSGDREAAFDNYDDFAQEDSKTASAAAASAVFQNEPPVSLRSLGEVEALNQGLKSTLVENRDQPRVGSQATTYRVRVNEEGKVIGYQSIGEEAEKALGETPLPDLLQSAPGDVPSVDYRVVFTERGVIEVSPWWGWSYYE